MTDNLLADSKMISTSVQQLKLQLSRMHDLLGNQNMTKGVMNPSTAWDLYCQMYPAQERKVMNLAQITRFKKIVARKRHRSTSSSSSSSRDSNKRRKVVDTCTPTLERIKCSLFNHLAFKFHSSAQACLGRSYTFAGFLAKITNLRVQLMVMLEISQLCIISL
jgi:hypothetical protein